MDDQPVRVLLGSVDIGDDIAFDELFDELQAWLVDQKHEPFQVEQRRSVAQVGATGIGTEILIALFGAGAGVALDDAWEFLRGRLGGSAKVSDFAYLGEIPSERLGEELVAMVAQAIGARRVDVRAIDIYRDADQVRGICETLTGERYEIRAVRDFFLISLLENSDSER